MIKSHILMSLVHLIRQCCNTLGIDLVRIKNSPRFTLLGLRNFAFRTIIDVGANEGQFARSYLEYFTGAQFYCFEPVPEPYRKLLEWAETNNGKITCYNIALGDHEGVVEMHRHNDHTPSSSLLQATDQCHRIYPQTQSESQINVRLSTLDEALKDKISRMSGPILLKLDVQGFEDRVLRGAPQILALCDACILEVSLDPLYNGQAMFADLVDIFKNAGLTYRGNLNQTYGDDGRVVFLDAVFAR
jgi:FkbM family methyltransferase